ncbi:hypothetical protein LCGC14_1259210 [marine sediment metagenome]|uniref:Uncharacterized protein n=1 Tax=marine sediment metagenome TaxID=412755 RepID=A0A0F9L3P1_9ZZZZ
MSTQVKVTVRTLGEYLRIEMHTRQVTGRELATGQ